MATKRNITRAELRLRAKRLLAAAGSALAEPLAVVAGFKDAKAFKAQLIKSLSADQDFHKAAHDLHGIHADMAALKAPKGSAKAKGGIKASGRIQASRLDPSLAQWDRSRGKRNSQGKRVGKRQRKR